jgi:hypothetical protein
MCGGIRQRFDQQLAQVENLYSAISQGVGETVVLLLGAVDPGQAVEQQGIVIAWRQPPQLVAGTVQHDRTQPANFRLDTRRDHRSC